MNMEFATKLPKPAAQCELSFPARYARFGTFRLDLQRQELFRNGARVRVPGKAYQVLATLLECPGEIVAREALRMRLWPADTHVNFEANVNTTVNKLRLILGDSNDASAYIETVPRKGYSFIAKVDFVDHLAIAGAAPNSEISERTWWSLRSVSASRWFGADRGILWFKAGVITLVIAAMLFGAALTLFHHRTF
jgi:DNA-binding winged helix-turn-helix (wHTH) protein